MSDPVTNLEIEDVLSSIRRLVSADARPRNKGMTRPVDDKPDRLVLTPAQRVASNHEAESPQADELVFRSKQPDAADARFFHAKDEVEAEDMGALDLPGEEIDPVDEDEAPGRSTFIARLVSEEMQRMLASGNEDAPQDRASPAPDAGEAKADASEIPPKADAVDSNSLVAKIAALEALIASRPDTSTARQDIGETARFVHRAVESVEWEDRSDTAAASPEPEAAPREENRLQEALVLGGPPWRGSTAPDDTARDQDASPAATAVASQATAVAAIDEEMLRGMVSDIVRQELQGALGERITRNVRKLVRREIHRMLVSQELE